MYYTPGKNESFETSEGSVILRTKTHGGRYKLFRNWDQQNNRNITIRERNTELYVYEKRLPDAQISVSIELAISSGWWFGASAIQLW